MKADLVKTKIPYFVFQDGDKFVAYSPALDLSSCGDTEKEACKMFEDAARIFIAEIIRMGTVDDVLTECGWRKAEGGSWSPPTYKQEFVQVAEGV